MNVRVFGKSANDTGTRALRSIVQHVELKDGTWGEGRFIYFSRWRPDYNRVTTAVNAIDIFSKAISVLGVLQ